MAELTQQELDERVALLRKFRSVLEQQRNKFQEYLTVLEKQQDSITKENPENLIAHTELEQQVVKNIANLQKVIVPMSKMYKASVPMAHTVEDSNIAQIQNELNDCDILVVQCPSRWLTYTTGINTEDSVNTIDKYQSTYLNLYML